MERSSKGAVSNHVDRVGAFDDEESISLEGVSMSGVTQVDVVAEAHIVVVGDEGRLHRVPVLHQLDIAERKPPVGERRHADGVQFAPKQSRAVG